MRNKKKKKERKSSKKKREGKREGKRKLKKKVENNFTNYDKQNMWKDRELNGNRARKEEMYKGLRN